MMMMMMVMVMVMVIVMMMKDIARSSKEEQAEDARNDGKIKQAEAGRIKQDGV